MRIVCDNPHHDAGEGVCVHCVQKRIDEAVQAERERCARIAASQEALGGGFSWPAQVIAQKIREGH